MTGRLSREQGPIPLLASILRELPRLDGGLCRGRHQVFDTPEPGTDPEIVEYRRHTAVSICKRCPALTACAAWVDSLPLSQRPAGVVAGHIANHHYDARKSA